MKFSNLLYTTIMQNLGMIIMVVMGFQTFGIPLKWIILFSVVGLYIKYELLKEKF